jgi:DNA-binding transcriptional ArsR family regulator
MRTKRKKKAGPRTRKTRTAKRGEAAARAWTAGELAELLGALGDATRLTVATYLARDGMLLRDAAHAAGVSRQAATKHLEALARGGVFTQERWGRRRWWWSPRPERLEEASRALASLAAEWRAAGEARKAETEALLRGLDALLGRK